MQSEPSSEPSKQEKGGSWAATHWSVVVAVQAGSDDALNTLFSTYRQPLYIYLRSRGRTHHDAEDLVHGFFTHLLKQDFAKELAPEKGRFRTFLLKSLHHYLCDKFDEESAAKRNPQHPLKSLDEADDKGHAIIELPDPQSDPQRIFDRAWARTVLELALNRLREECARLGHQALCDELVPTFYGDADSLSYREIGDRLGMTEGNVKVAAHRIRRRLRFLICKEIKQTVTNKQDWEEECAHLMNLF